MDNHDNHTALLARLAEQAEALRSSEVWVEWLEVASRFHSYSLNNQLLILTQRPTATRVAGYRAWQALGRQVRKGERGLKIFAPCIRSAEDPDTGDKTSQLVGFRLVSVFDISQTDGDPLPQPEMPAVVAADGRLLEQLRRVAAAQGWSVEAVETAANGARGWWTPSEQRITLVESYDPASKTRTMLHELGHAFDYTLPGQNETAGRIERELIAESVAYLAGKTLGVDLDDASAFYVAAWGGDGETLRRIAQRVLDITQALTTAIAAATATDEVAA